MAVELLAVRSLGVGSRRWFSLETGTRLKVMERELMEAGRKARPAAGGNLEGGKE
jgi:hypothetical protein